MFQGVKVGTCYYSVLVFFRVENGSCHMLQSVLVMYLYVSRMENESGQVLQSVLVCFQDGK